MAPYNRHPHTVQNEDLRALEHSEMDERRDIGLKYLLYRKAESES